jgi:hypothetical protein
MLPEKVGEETANKIRIAHKTLPVLFRHIKTDTKIAYPFKYDCLTGKFLYPNLEDNMLHVGMGKQELQASLHLSLDAFIKFF